MDLNAYLPMDRVSALLLDTSLPEKTHGTALFADISGFTALTEMFAQVFGARRGAEELTQHLNRIYDLLIDEVHRYRGSVISFSGDGITCWFDGEASARAIQCAFATQQALDVAPMPWETFPSVDEGRASQWVIPGVYARLKEGLGEYVTELRPAVSLFLQFEGIDYEADSDARDKLDQYIRHVQQILTHFDGTLIQLTTIDK